MAKVVRVSPEECLPGLHRNRITMSAYHYDAQYVELEDEAV